jgi:hypothetical protein
MSKRLIIALICHRHKLLDPIWNSTGQIGLICRVWKKKRFTRNVEYIERVRETDCQSNEFNGPN